MADSITFSLGAGSTMTVTAHSTTTPGLIVHDQGLFGDTWRLTHRPSGAHLGEFGADCYRNAQEAATALHGIADWTAGPEALQDETVIWLAIDAIENAGGTFLPREGGLGERVAAKRRAYMDAKTKETTT